MCLLNKKIGITIVSLLADGDFPILKIVFTLSAEDIVEVSWVMGRAVCLVDARKFILRCLQRDFCSGGDRQFLCIASLLQGVPVRQIGNAMVVIVA